MRIGIDVRKLGDGGIGTYVRETVSAAARIAPEVRWVAFGAPGDRDRLPVSSLEWVGARAGHYSIAEHLTLPLAARRRKLDVYHAPHYVLPFGMRGPCVVTIHDLIHILVPRTRLHPIYARWMMRSACRRAARVIVVSETTANDLRRNLDVPAEKIRVIPNGVDPRFRPLSDEVVDRDLARIGLRRPYVLFVGNALPHKNVPTLVRAWGDLPEPRPDLVLCGAGHDVDPAVTAAIAEVGGAERVRKIGVLADEALVSVYNGAELLVSTALYEGFCMPVLEAFASGTPVLAPDAGAVPEVAGGAARLVPPRRVDLITTEMYRLLGNRELRAELVEKGARRVRSFSWEDAARKTLSIYEEVS